MLSISNLSGSGKDLSKYFEKEAGQKEYWSKEAQESARWHGYGAELLGLNGPVDQAQFEKIMDGHLPNGTIMPGGQGGERRMGYDLTFSASKSVSLQALVAGDSRVIAAHDQAVTRALDWLQKNAAQTQIKANREIGIYKTDNIVAAVFRHETSRELDPQLHSHAVLANLTQGSNGKWRALENSEIYKLRMSAGAVYRAELAHELKQLGYSVHQTTSDGRFEIDGYSQNQLVAFSTRRQQIESALEKYGVDGAQAAEKAALMTRQSKQSLTEQGKEGMRAEWQERAESLGIDVSVTGEETLTSSNLETVKQKADKAVVYATEHLSERSSTFQDYRMRQVVIQQLVGHGRIDDVQPAIDRAIQSRNLLAITTEDGVRYATRESLQREIQTVGIMQRGRGISTNIATPETIEPATEGLNPGQAEAANLILTSHDRTVGVQGYAGSGKTFMLNRVAQVAVDEGYTVKALAPTASAAQTLGAEIGAEGHTLASHLLDRTQTSPDPAAKELWIVDEAGLISTKDMRALLGKAEREGAKVALVGDTRQLRGVEAGLPFKSLQERGLNFAEMSQVMRHKSVHLAKTVDLIRQGKGQEAIAMMREGKGAKLEWVQPSGRTDGKEPTWEEKRMARLEAATNKYMEARQAGSEVLLVAERRDDRSALNNMVRDRLIERGEVQAEGMQTSILIGKDMVRAEARMAHSYQAGDVVEFGRSYKSLDTTKGERLTVQDVDYKRGLVNLQNDAGEQVQWNPSKLTKAQAYSKEQVELAQGDKVVWTKNDHINGRRNGQLADVVAVDRQDKTATIRLQNGQEQKLDLADMQHLDHAHASTIYKSQGRTVDHVIVASNTQSRESAYVAVSRAREQAEMIVNSPEGQAQAIDREQEPDNVLDLLKDHEEVQEQGQNLYETSERNPDEQQQQRELEQAQEIEQEQQRQQQQEQEYELEM